MNLEKSYQNTVLAYASYAVQGILYSLLPAQGEGTGLRVEDQDEPEPKNSYGTMLCRKMRLPWLFLVLFRLEPGFPGVVSTSIRILFQAVTEF